MRTVAITSTWNNALWIRHYLKWAYPLFDRLIIQEANWTSDDGRWAGATSPDGTADIICGWPDPKRKIEFYQLGRWNQGCLAARAELCSHIPECDWVYVADVDEFQSNQFLNFLDLNFSQLKKQGYKTVSQNCRAFYWDFTRHTDEGFTRLMRWYPGINCWHANYFEPKDFHVPTEMGEPANSPTEMGHQIYHYSYVPPPGVEIKGAQSFDVSLDRYQSWYRNTFSKFDGSNLDEVYNTNQGGVHVFGGCQLHDYHGPHPEVLNDHPLRHARWTGSGYVSIDNEPIDLTGWWNQ